MAEMAPVIIEAIDFIVETWQDVAYSALGNKVDFIRFITFFIDVFFILGIVRL
jgi:hypothetical protein